MKQLSTHQVWALHELARGVGPSDAVHTRTLRSLQHAGLARENDGEWTLTKAGERAAVKATERLQRRSA